MPFHLIDLARSGRRLTHPLLAWALAMVVAGVGTVAGGVAVGLLLWVLDVDMSPSEPLASALVMVLLLVGSFAPVALLLGLWVRLFEGRPLWTLGLERAGALARYLRGALVGVALYTAVLVLCAASGALAYEPGDPSQQGLAALGGVLLVYLGWTVQGPVEELLCRGWLLPVVAARTRLWIGVLASSLVFTVLHGLNPGVTPLALVNLLLFSLFAALYVLWEGGLWGICALHAAWNWTQGNLFGLAVSGAGAGGGVLLNLQTRGPDLLTGGSFGPEGSLATTIVLLLASAVLLWRLRVRRRLEMIHEGHE
ncbi:MAG TPA: type II CAAX endopeptidase family protein [Roseiflexaceae bacterium]|nr:type II CAAX endopeptidase family protein [Roseiflexaceae bacterium]